MTTVKFSQRGEVHGVKQLGAHVLSYTWCGRPIGWRETAESDIVTCTDCRLAMRHDGTRLVVVS